MRVVSWIVSICFIIYFYGVIDAQLHNGLLSFIGAFFATVGLWLIVGFVLGLVANVFGGDTPSRGSWSPWTRSSAKRIEAPPAPAPTVESQMSWDEKMRNGGRMAPPE